jgi:Recombination endonuclease VII
MAAPKAPKGERGYGYAYQKLRKALLPSAYGTPCVRCGQPMLPGQKLHLDHDDYDHTKLRGFAHAECNIRAAAKKARAKQIAAKQRAIKPVHRW